MDNHTLPDQFIKSWIFAFIVGVTVVGALIAMDLLPLDKVLLRQAPAWAALVVGCSIDPVLRYFGILKAEIEHRWADVTIATLIGRSTGALCGSVFAWGVAVLGG